MVRKSIICKGQRCSNRWIVGRRDSTLFQFTSKRLRDYIAPDHLLIQMDEQLDFAKLVVPLEAWYCPNFSRPAIQPEALVRALII